MKNWKTTIIGAIIGGLVAIQPLFDGSDFTVTQLLTAFAIAAFGVVSKDFNVSGTGK